MTAGTVVITGGILAAVILLCIIAILCYCRLQYYCCKKEDVDDDEEEPDFAMHSHIPPFHYNPNVASTNGPSLYSPFMKNHSHSRNFCPNCSSFEVPIYLHPPEDVRNGGDRIAYQAITQKDLEVPISMANLQNFNPSRLSAMRATFSRSKSISTDV
ncbi:protein FAM163B [Latimeria chalumnae]|uniref:Family with sequence similarity 163 member B n=1 Tax=Latimeria chalumnae TaxID=7897 RepID=H3AKD4_LATCH|nr:PREDICTED: protein FAM163B [Latimeria chalumnae]|eukprot:XP_005990667.1 PREDICTED: protein FAM163B [Latimeria chalumnae]